MDRTRSSLKRCVAAPRCARGRLTVPRIHPLKMEAVPRTNVHYVSLLTYNPADPVPPETRIVWLKRLFEFGPFPMTLFADEHYRRLISMADHPGLTILPWDQADSEVWRRAREAEAVHGHPLQLPARRNEAKDTEYFMLLMHAKAEVVALASRLLDTPTPFLAFLDAGITKIFGNVEACVNRLQTVQLSAEKMGGSVLVPGCWAPKLWSQEFLAGQINWTFCGGIFFLQREVAETFWEAQLRALDLFLAKGTLTWEVNTWVLMIADSAAPQFHWFPADHNDKMSVIPQEFLEGTVATTKCR